jgi:hypothetical protein
MEQFKKLAVELQRSVLSDITVEMQKIKDEGLIVDEQEMLIIINNLSHKYGNS